MSAVKDQTVEPSQSWESQLFEHDRQLLSCRFSPCGKFVFAGGNDRLVHRWELTTGKKTALAGHASWVEAMAFHPDGKRLLTSDYVGQLRCWVYADDTPKLEWSVETAHQSSIRAVDVSSDDRFVATAGHDQIVRVWSASDGKPVCELTGHESPIFCIAFHPDGKQLVSAEQYGPVKHWDATTGKLVRDLAAAKIFWTDASLSNGAHSCGVRSMTFHESGNVLTCAGITELKDGDRRNGNASILFLDWKDGKRKRIMQAKGAGYVERYVFHPAGYVLASCLGQENGSIQFWQIDKDEAVKSIKAGCRDIDLHPDGERFAVTEWKKNGRVGNNPSTDKEDEYTWHHGVVRIYTMTPKLPAAATDKKTS